MYKIVVFSAMLLLSWTLPAVAQNKSFTLVIDAGHGGRDEGAPGAISKEKNLTLKYALAFGKLVEQECPDVKVVYTRKSDVFVELKERAAIANRVKADLFISVHINALSGGRIARGFQTYTLGKGRSGSGISDNLEVAKRENAVILLEDDYKESYQGFDPDSPESNIIFEFMQDKNMEQSVHLAKEMQKNVCAATGRQNGGAHQANLAVLRLSTMPGCLVELGFISTPDEERFLNSPEAVGRYSRGMMNAFNAYRGMYDKIVNVPYRPPVRQDEEPKQQDERNARRNDSKGDNPRHKNANGDAPRPKDGNVSTASDDAAAQSKPQQNDGADNNGVSAGADGVPVFKVQILVASSKLKSGDPHLKGIKGYDYYQEAGYYKYTVGASANYNEIYRLRKQILGKFPEAFIIAFRNGAKMNVNEAIREFKNNRAK